jgi:hypothetical protein
MAESTSTTLTRDELNALSGRLSDHADGIVNVAAHEMEQDIRLAASALRQIESVPSTASLPALLHHIDRIDSTIDRIATACPDAVTSKQLRRLIGKEA